MLHYAVAPYVGGGTDGDPFRPRGADEVRSWSAIDLRPPRSAYGFALLATPERPRDARLLHLGDGADARSSRVRRLLGNRLGLTLEADVFPRMVADLLLRHSREDGTRWRPLQPAGPFYEIWLGGLLWRRPVLAGAATVTESWPTISTIISSGQDQVWTELENNMQVTGGASSNVIAPVTLGANCRARCETALETTDHYAQMTVAEYTDPSSSINLFELCCRMAAADHTAYVGGYVRTTTVHRREIQRLDAAGAATALLTEDGIVNAAPGDSIRLETIGSTINLYKAGAFQTSVTDTIITAGVRGGIKIRNTNANRVQGDNFQAADIIPTGQPTMRRWGGVPGMNQYTGRRGW